MLGVNPYMLENERFRYFACNAFKYYNLEMTVFTSNCSFLVFAFVFKYDLYFFYYRNRTIKSITYKNNIMFI